MRPCEGTEEDGHTNKHPVISPDVFNSVNHFIYQSSVFGHRMIGYAHVDHILAKMVNRYGCIGPIPLNCK